MQIAGSVVKRLRWSRGWSISELASRSGVGADTIANIEDGDSAGSPKTAKKIADALGCTVMDIVSEDGEVPVGAIGQAIVGEDNQGEDVDGTSTTAVG